MVTDSQTSLEWLRLSDEEELLWQSRPRIFEALPVVLVGVLVCAGGLAGAWLETVWLAGIVPVGFLLAIWALLSNRRTWYVVTTRGLYLKTGVIGRRVRSIEYNRVQNSQYRQSIRGTLFGHGSVEVEVDGESDLTFAGIYDPDEIQEQVRAQIGRQRSTSADAIPGSREEWIAVRDELRRIRTALK